MASGARLTSWRLSRCPGTPSSARRRPWPRDLPVIAVILIGIVGPTAGRYFIDLTSGVTPQQFTKGEWFVGTAVLTSITYIILDALGLAAPSVWPATLLAWAVGFSFRRLSLHFKWGEPEPWDQARFHYDNDQAEQPAETAR